MFSCYKFTGRYRSGGWVCSRVTNSQEVIGQVVGSDHVTLLSRSDDTVSLVQLSNGFEQHSYDMGDVAVGRGDVLSVRTLPSSHPCSLGQFKFNSFGVKY